MDRSFAARLVRPLGAAGPPRSSRGSARTARRPPAPASSPLALAGRLSTRAQALLRLAWRRRAARTALLAALAALPLLYGGWLLLRRSSFVAVEQVRIGGVHGPEAGAIEAALRGAARHMSTLQLQTSALRAAAAPFPVVAGVRATPHFPHGLSIQVLEQLPVAALVVGGTRTAVAADGVVLGPALLSGSLPSIRGYAPLAAGAHVHDGVLLAQLAVLGAAPRVLLAHIVRLYTGPYGLTVALRGGVLAYFGDATLPHAKWMSLARVLADGSSAGATYVDVRLPARPAAGGFPAGAGPAASEAARGEQSSSSTESTVGALAASLGASTPGGSSTSTPSGAASPTGSTTAGAGESPAASSTTPSTEASTSGEAAQESGASAPAPSAETTAGSAAPSG